MKIAVLNNSVPFLRGGAEHLAESLCRELGNRGHQVEHVKIPLRWSSPRAVAESMVAAASIRVSDADRVIALKFPAYLVPHPCKVVWLMHQFRQVYDFWGTPLQDLPDGAETAGLRRAIRAADNRAMADARAVFCNSSVTAERLQRFNGHTSSVLLAPHGDTTGFRRGPFGDYILATGRITASKRQHLLVEAMAYTKGSLRLVVAGAPETPGDLDVLTSTIATHGLEGRVEVIPRFISEEEKRDLLARCRAVAYLPVDEDSYGYVTAEAMMSGKPVVTCRDSGGILELVEHGATGFVSEPTPPDLARAIDELSGPTVLAESLGAAAAERVTALDLSWERTIGRLLA